MGRHKKMQPEEPSTNDLNEKTSLAFVENVRKAHNWQISLGNAKIILKLVAESTSKNGEMTKKEWSEIGKQFSLTGATVRAFFLEMKRAFNGNNGKADKFEYLEDYYAAQRPYRSWVAYRRTKKEK